MFCQAVAIVLLPTLLAASAEPRPAADVACFPVADAVRVWDGAGNGGVWKDAYSMDDFDEKR